ncbi:TnsA endonuclease N-terminal domain-containing protein [Brevibacillus brevis]|uniref:TnsA endonuclease N-terminal domain-containing protein n=1 Tax=Brevibacillus brevis TaxID=1393 RepID=UPI0025A5D072|nr:TnsA endonuclease N-terminal domain-containing protein [Brevibacillus brevis]WJQ81934.1 TnsA endonuclease N-terminal domain-containing protein [Brevibacillus brevis]
MVRESSIQSLIQRWKKEGRGQGIGANYKPYFTAKQVPSRGKTFRPRGIKTGREHLFLSEWEYFYFLLLEWSDLVVDIREQFPLLDIEETVEIATELNVKHPIDPQNKDLKVMTTDFLITFQDGSEYAVSFKPFKSITAREIEKMEIERIYWARRGITWELVTDKDCPKIFAKNIDYVHSPYYLKDYHISDSTVVKAKRLMEPMIMKRQSKLTEITDIVDDRLGLIPGSSLTIARHLIITKQWVINMDQIIDPNSPLQIVRYVRNEKGGEERYAN